MKKEQPVYIVVIVNLLIICFSVLFAQDYGKIKGVVVDGILKTPVQEAQVYLEGQYLGDVTDYSGAYEIRNVPPGTYTLVVDMMGYEKVVKKNVKVLANQVTELNFELYSRPIAGEEIVVTATKTDKTLEDVPAAVYVISEKNIELSDSRNIEEMLDIVPGVFTQDRFHAGYNNVSFRGIGLHTHVTRGILVLVDGIPINEAMGRIDFEQLNFDDVQKIEVLKGPVSALYGPNGITGVINVLTKEPPVKWTTTLKATAGSYGTTRFTADAGGRLGRFGLVLNASHYYSDGYYLNRNTYNTNKFSTKFRTDYETIGSLIFTTQYVKAKTDFPGPLTKEMYESGSRENTRKFTGSDKDLLMIGLANRKYWNTHTDLETNFFYRKKKDDYAYVDYFSIDKNLDNYGGEIKFHTDFNFLNRFNSFICGVSYTREDGTLKYYNLDSDGNRTDLTSDGTSIYDLIGFYVQDDFTPISRLTFTLGARYDIVKYDWRDNFLSDGNSSATTSISSISPKFALVYSPSRKLSLFANVGKGFNPPQISELYVGSYTSKPNPDLTPEYLTNYEIGFRGNCSNRLNYQMSLFWMDFKDQIVTNDVTHQYENVGETSHKGVETAIQAQLHQNITLTLTYSYLEAKFEDYPGYTGNTLRQTPKNQIGGKLRYSNSWGIIWDVDVKWIDKYYLDNSNEFTYDGHTVVNTRISYEKSHFLASLNLNNVFDTRYATWAYAYYSYRTRSWTEYYYPGWPFNVTATIGIKF